MLVASWVPVLRDPISSASHYGGLVYALFATVILWRLAAGDWRRQASLACFGISSCLLFAASGTFHALCLPPAELEFYRLLDHSAIYLLIAGTYTPVFALLLRGNARLVFLLLMWTMAGVGIVSKWSLPATAYPFTVSLYLVMGWTGMLAVPVIYRRLGWSGFRWGILGGLFYSGGAILDVLHWPVLVPGTFGSHEFFHFCVLGGN